MKTISKSATIFGLVGCLVLGISFRFVNLDLKAYSYDEAITSLRISGNSWQEAVAQFDEQPVLSVAQLIERHQSVQPDRGVGASVLGLAQEEAQLTPLYFVLVRIWAQLVGDSVAAVRSFSAVLSVITLGLLYRLTNRLFRDSLMALTVAAIASVSPFLVLYAQDARPYSLLTLVVVLSADTLLSALNRNTRAAWSLYGLSAVVGLYTHLLFALVLVGHSIYVVGMAVNRKPGQSRDRALLWRFGSSLGIAIAALTPWLWLMQRYPGPVADRVGSSLASWQTLLVGLFSIVRFSTRSLLDADWAGGVLQVNPAWLEAPAQASVALVSVSLIGTACYRLWVRTPFSVWGIVLLPVLVTLLALLLKGAVTERYLLVYFVTLPIALGYFLTHRFRTAPTRRNVWLSITSLVLIAAICSDTVSARSTLWTIKYPSSTAQNIDVAAALNQAESPCLIVYQAPRQAAFGKSSEDKLGRLLSLSHWLNPAITLNLLNAPEQFTFSPSCQTHFLYLPSPPIEKAIQAQGYELQPIGQIAPGGLQQVVKKAADNADNIEEPLSQSLERRYQL